MMPLHPGWTVYTPSQMLDVDWRAVQCLGIGDSTLIGVVSFRWGDTQRFKDYICIASFPLTSAFDIRHVQAQMKEMVLRMVKLAAPMALVLSWPRMAIYDSHAGGEHDSFPVPCGGRTHL